MHEEERVGSSIELLCIFFSTCAEIEMVTRGIEVQSALMLCHALSFVGTWCLPLLGSINPRSKPIPLHWILWRDTAAAAWCRLLKEGPAPLKDLCTMHWLGCASTKFLWKLWWCKACTRLSSQSVHCALEHPNLRLILAVSFVQTVFT